MSKLRGLPPEKRMRHDSHFVEAITSEHSEAVGRLIDIERIEPNPHQPRKDLGDLAEMVASIKDKGILEPILVRSHEGNYQIIAGERRYQAARLAGLRHLPCIEVDVDARGMLEISLIENLQRKDLSAFEEAGALQRLCEQFRYTHDEIARKLGKSRTAITEALSLNRMPDEIRERCRQADIDSKSMLLQVVRQETSERMHELIDRISGDGITREEARRFGQEEGRTSRPRNFVFRFEPADESFRVRLTFGKAEVDRMELVRALQQIVEQLMREVAAEGEAREGNGREGLASGVDWAGLRET